MRRLLDRLVNTLLRWAPWYRPDEIRAREVKTELIRRFSIRWRIYGEQVLSPARAASYRRARIGR